MKARAVMRRLAAHARSPGRTAGVAMIAAVLSLPSIAYACPVCFDANEANRTAFIATTIFLSLLPLAMIGGVAYWIRQVTRGS